MSFTKRFTLTASWQPLTSAGGAGFVQLHESKAAQLHLAGSAPAVDTLDYMLLVPGEMEEMPFQSAEGTDILYGRSGSAANVDVVVMATGSAPA